ncbi:kinase-like domain-containing protein [Rhizophagus clarus]|uniref:Kinase-like domain-containing protein n=1 Tax=Rhizophagus clarus TaxID=94130 RepID=A0A8H3M796_9GLOM|nr:kinase-like domain-containing protein [Rhizophagus clarus]
MLYKIISGLTEIHEQYLVHCDFHDSNILNHEDKEDEEVKDEVFISNLGLCQPIKSFLKKDDIFGVIPFMVPEVLRGKPYTPASWIFHVDDEIGKELKSNIMEFINAPIGNNNFITKSHPQAYHTSRLLDFTSRKVDEILKSERLNYILVDNSKNLNEIVDSECLGCIINNIKSPDIKSDQN